MPGTLIPVFVNIYRCQSAAKQVILLNSKPGLCGKATVEARHPGGIRAGCAGTPLFPIAPVPADGRARQAPSSRSRRLRDADVLILAVVRKKFTFDYISLQTYSRNPPLSVPTRALILPRIDATVSVMG